MKMKSITQTAALLAAVGICAAGCSNASNLYKRGDALLHAERYKEAMEQLNGAIQKDPEFASAYAKRGVCYWHLNEPRKATDDFEKAISLGNREPYTYEFCAWAYGIQSNNIEALRILNAGIDANPTAFNSLFFRACTYYELGEYEKALADLDKTIELKPDHPKIAMLRSNITARVKEKMGSQQSGPEYPPQGVGSPEP